MKKIMIALICMFTLAGTTQAFTFSENSMMTEEYSDQMIKDVQSLGRLAAEEGYDKMNDFSAKLDMVLFGYFQDAYDQRRAELDATSEDDLIFCAPKGRFEHDGMIFYMKYGI